MDIADQLRRLQDLREAGAVSVIIGGIKANDGILWKYPLSIPFLE